MAQQKRGSGSSKPRKKTTSRGGASRRSAQKQQPRVWQWYAAGVVSGVVMSLLFYLATLPPEGGAAGPGLASSSGSAGDNTDQTEEPRFDFYTMLENQNIDVEVDPAEIEHQRGSQSSEVYLLQTGSFRQLEDADRRRAELLLIGLAPTIEETNGDNGRWYRVYVGPFNSRSKMAKARALTAEQDIDTLLLKRKPN